MNDNISYLKSKGWSGVSSGNELKGECPSMDHTDNNPSFYINVETGSFQCFSCGMKGKSLVSLMMYVENISKEEAINILNPAKEKNDIYEFIRGYCHYTITYKGSKPQSVIYAKKEVANNLRNRNLPLAETVFNYSIGWSHRNMIKTGLERGYSVEDFNRAGICKNGSYFTEGRICIPFTYRGRLIGFSFRDVEGSDRKYINIYKEHSNSWLAFLESGEDIIVTEGVFDAISLKTMGFNACATMGTAMNKERVKLLGGFKKIYLMMDSDKAGLEAMEKILINSLNEIPSSQIYICELPKGKDPDNCDTDTIKNVVNCSKPCYNWLVNKYLKDSSDYMDFIKKLSLLKKRINDIKDEHFKSIFKTIIDKEIENSEIIFKPTAEHDTHQMFRAISECFKHMQSPLVDFKLIDGNPVLEIGNNSFAFNDATTFKRYINSKKFSMIHSPNSGWSCRLLEE